MPRIIDIATKVEHANYYGVESRVLTLFDTKMFITDEDDEISEADSSDVLVGKIPQDNSIHIEVPENETKVGCNFIIIRTESENQAKKLKNKLESNEVNQRLLSWSSFQTSEVEPRENLSVENLKNFEIEW